ncbi:MAG: two-component sensor histidine kinase, partial [Mesorhizobium sp.]
MVDKGEDQEGATQATVAGLRRSPWLLAAAVVAVLAVYAFGGLSIYVPLLALALMAAAASSADCRSTSAGSIAAAIEAGGLQRLSGEYLAAAVADPLIIFD